MYEIALTLYWYSSDSTLLVLNAMAHGAMAEIC